MGFRYRKKIAPGITLNMSKSGPSVSGRVGPRGAGVSVNTRGTVTGGVGAGGVRYQKQAKLGATGSKSEAQPQSTSKWVFWVALAVVVLLVAVL